MEKYRLPIAIAFILLVVALVIISKKSPVDPAAQTCLESGGAYDASTGTCAPAGAAAPQNKGGSLGTLRRIPPTPPPTPASQPPAYPTARTAYDPAAAATMIRVTSPLPGAVLNPAKTVTVSGEAIGSWYFSETFPVLLTDAQGKVLTKSHATAQGTWMVPDFVSFTGTLNFHLQPPGSRGFIVILRNNPSPSEFPQNNATVTIPVRFP